MILFFSLPISLWSQGKNTISFNDVQLDTALSQLEDIFDIKFSYNSKLTKNKTLTLPETKLDISLVLKRIQQEALINYTKVSERYYILFENKNSVLCGYLFNSNTNELIQNAIITNKTNSSYTTSNAIGFFEINYSSSSDVIEVESFGYASKRLNIELLNKDFPCSKISMSNKIISLNEVVIKDYLTTGISKNHDGSIKAFPKELQILPGLIEPDILQSLQLIPGIQNADESSTALNIRGGTPDQNLILWDGIKMYHYGHFFGMLSSFNPYITNDVKLFKSGVSAMYGNTTSGVLDINSDSDIPERTSGGLGTNMISGDIYLKTPISKNIGIIASARRSYTDIIQTATFDAFSDHVFQNTKITENNQPIDQEISNNSNTYYFTDFTVKAIVKPTKNDLITLSTIYSKNELSYILESEFTDFNRIAKNQLDINNAGASLTWKKEWNSSISHSFTNFYSKYDYDYFDEGIIPNSFFFKNSKNNKIRDFNSLLRLDYTLNKNQSLSLGYEFSNTNLLYTINNFLNDTSISDPTNDFFETNNTKNNTHAAFSEYNIRGKKWSVNAGVRIQHFSTVDQLFLEPRLVGKLKLSPRYSLKFSVHQLHQNISQVTEFDATSLRIQKQLWVLANNTDVPLLKSQQVDLGIIYKKNGWYFDIEGYYKNIDGITSFSLGFNGDAQGFSIGKSETYGIDFLIKKKYGVYSSWISYSLSNTEFVFEDLNQGRPFSGNFDIRHYITWAQSIKLNNFEFSLGWKFRTSTPYTPAQLSTIGITDIIPPPPSIDYGKINSARLNPYHRLDFSATYNFKMPYSKNINGKIGFSILNVYNQKNILNRSYTIGTDDTDLPNFNLREINKTSLSFTPNAVIRLTF